MTIIYTLYIKTHNVTQLKYLGFTTKDPFTYKGSGTYWKRHIKKYGYDVTTEVLFQTTNKQEIGEKGQYYSIIWDIVNAVNENGIKIWANLAPETANGGVELTEEQKKQLSQKMKEHHNTPEFKEKISKSTRESFKNPKFKEKFLEKVRSPENRKRASEQAKIRMNNPVFREKYLKKVNSAEHKQKISGEHHFAYDSSIYTFRNDVTNEEIKCTKYEFVEKFSCSSSCISRILMNYNKSYKGWRRVQDDGTVSYPTRTTNKKWYFKHDSGVMEYCTPLQLIKKYLEMNLMKENILSLVNKDYMIYNGWQLLTKQEIKQLNSCKRKLNSYKQVKQITFSYKSELIEICSIEELIKKYPTHDLTKKGLFKLFKGYIQSYKGWKVIVDNENHLSKKTQITRNTIIHTFIHVSGLVEKCSQVELIRKYPDQKLSKDGLYKMVKGTNRTYKGWEIESNSRPKTPRLKKIKYTFFHISGIIEHCSQIELIKKYPEQKLDPGTMSLLARGLQPSYKGWRIINNK